MTTHQIPDGSRTLRFEGDLIAHSTSWRRGSGRWVEFSLYRTLAGQYVLARTGFSLLYHDPGCEVAARNSLSISPSAALDRDAVPCIDCQPADMLPEVAVESPRFWGHVSEDPEGVVEALQRHDSHGSRYLTRVAQRLLEEAGRVDPALDAVYRVEHIA